MHPLLTQACAQADQSIAHALGRSVSVPTRPSDRGLLFSAAPRALSVDARELAHRLELSRTWLEGVRAQNGFLNFTLGSAWYDEVVKQPPDVVPLPEVPPVPVFFPARIEPFDWSFLTALRGRDPEPALAARQDPDNPGALVRMTLRRLEQVEGRAPRESVWDGDRRSLCLLLARFEEGAGPKRQAICLERTARAVWEIGPLHLSGPLLRFTRSVLSRGCAALISSTEGETCLR